MCRRLLRKPGKHSEDQKGWYRTRMQRIEDGTLTRWLDYTQTLHTPASFAVFKPGRTLG